MSKRSVAMATCVMAGAFCAHAATWYVATNGDDENNNGQSAAAPFATIQKAINSASSFNTVEIADGTPSASIALTPTNTGTACGNPLIVQDVASATDTSLTTTREETPVE